MKQVPPDAIGRLLVVDDDEMNRDMLSRRLARKGFEVTVAEDGAEALEAIERETFDLVLLDIMMPGIDGLQVLERVRRERSPVELPIIMATAKDASEDVVYALKLGANDYVTKPLDFPVVLARVNTQLALRRATAELEAAHTRMKKDLDAAARVQHDLMPKTVPEIAGARFAWRFRPCDELAGDILDIFPVDAGRVGLYLLDVSGHGVPAALLSVTLSRVLSHMDEASLLFAPPEGGCEPAARQPAQVAHRLNERFPMSQQTRQYFTLAYGLLDPAARELTWVAAGHPGPLRIAADGTVTEHAPTGMAIGWFPHAKFEQQTLGLRSRDRVYFFSDGIVEAANREEEQFGLGRIGDVLSSTRSDDLETSLDVLLEEIDHWCTDAGVGDDVSLLAVEVD